MIGVYKITSPSGRVYVGQSIDIERRWNEYKKLIKCKSQYKLMRSFLKYGVDTHTFETLLECSAKDLNLHERYYQDLYQAVSRRGLNCKLTRTDSKSGALSESTKKKIGDSNRGKLTGKKRSKECIEKRLRTRELNRSDERVSDFFKGKQVSQLTREKISKTMRGRKQTPEHIEKAAKAKHKPILHIESGIVYPSRKAAEAAFNKTIDYGLKKGIFKYI
jgi:group I intron endonuclease